MQACVEDSEREMRIGIRWSTGEQGRDACMHARQRSGIEDWQRDGGESGLVRENRWEEMMLACFRRSRKRCNA